MERKGKDHLTSGRELKLAVPQSLRKAEEEQEAKKQQRFEELQRAGIDLSQIPEAELSSGDGEVLKCHVSPYSLNISTMFVFNLFVIMKVLGVCSSCTGFELLSVTENLDIPPVLRNSRSCSLLLMDGVPRKVWECFRISCKGTASIRWTSVENIPRDRSISYYLFTCLCEISCCAFF